jgi:hypothetical protein
MVGAFEEGKSNTVPIDDRVPFQARLGSMFTPSCLTRRV